MMEQDNNQKRTIIHIFNKRKYMNEHVKNATEFAFSDNVANMQQELELALKNKITDSLEQYKIDVAQNMFNDDSVNEDLEEKLSVEDGPEKWIHDFVHSNDPRFEGKSKEERTKQALSAFYQAKRAGV